MNHNFLLISLTLFFLWEIVTPMDPRSRDRPSSSRSNIRPVKLRRNKDNVLTFMYSDKKDKKEVKPQEHEVLDHCKGVMAAIHNRQRSIPNDAVNPIVTVTRNRESQEDKLHSTYLAFKSAYPEHMWNHIHHEGNKWPNSTLIKLDHNQIQQLEKHKSDLPKPLKRFHLVSLGQHYLKYVPQSLNHLVTSISTDKNENIIYEVPHKFLDIYDARAKAHHLNP